MVRIHLSQPVKYVLGCRQVVRQRTLTPSFRRFESFHPSSSSQATYRLWRFFYSCVKIVPRSFRCSSSPQKVTLGSAARLQAPSLRLAVANDLSRCVGISVLFTIRYSLFTILFNSRTLAFLFYLIFFMLNFKFSRFLQGAGGGIFLRFCGEMAVFRWLSH